MFFYVSEAEDVGIKTDLGDLDRSVVDSNSNVKPWVCIAPLISHENISA